VPVSLHAATENDAIERVNLTESQSRMM
jgi:hypothetical protein